MVLVISQQTFDEAVQENINDLGLSPEEAVSEAIEQFKAQGVDLSHIVTESVSGSSIQDINGAVAKLNRPDEGAPRDCLEPLAVLKQQCDKEIQYRVAAGNAGAYNAILDTLLRHEDDKEIKVACLTAMASLMTKQPDLLDDRGIQVILSNIGGHVDAEVLKSVLRWCKECCVMHEMNRQKLVDASIIDKLTALVKEGRNDVTKELAAVLRALILDDDVRVEFGRAHEHARLIAAETLGPITELLNTFKHDEGLVGDLMLTLSALLVRAEFCKTVEEAGGLELIHDAMVTHAKNEKINRQCFKLLKALAGNDECKSRIVQKGLAPVICNSLGAHKNVAVTAKAGLQCVATLSLRNPDNSKALYEASLPEVIVATMRQHPQEKSIQKTGSWAIRNMVSRSRYQNQKFLELGVEDILKDNLARFREFEYDIKAALRDLECDVELKEEWTGKGGKLSSESTRKVNTAK